MEILKKWKERPISIGDFEDLWEENKRFEVARAYLILLKDSPSILLEEKIEFFLKIIEKSQWFSADDNNTVRDENLRVLAIKAFLELIPSWDDKLEDQCVQMIKHLSRVSFFSDEHKKGWEGKIKTFIHSCLNAHKKKEMDECIVVSALIENKMFEELINYGFVSSSAIDRLWIFLFNEAFKFYDGFMAKSLTDAEQAQRRFEKISGALMENRQPHAVSVLLRLLAKRGDLDNIFSASAETKQ